MLSPAAGRGAEITFYADAVETPVFSAKGVSARLGTGALQFSIGEIAGFGRARRDVRVDCGELRLERGTAECRRGVLHSRVRIPFTFTYRSAQRTVDATAAPGLGQSWRLHADLAADNRRIEVDGEGIALPDLAFLIPGTWPSVRAGSARARLIATGAEHPRLEATIALRGAAFSDAAGLRAGEKLDVDLAFQATDRGGDWNWQAEVTWRGGEVFWQPLYLKAGGQTLRAEGRLDAQRIVAERTTVGLPGVGEFQVRAEWDRAAGRLASAAAQSSRLDAGGLYAMLVQPYLAGTALADLRTAGAVELSALSLRHAQIESLVLSLHDLSFEDRSRRFAIFGANGRIPWHRENATRAELSISGGEVLRVPFGAADIPLALHGPRFRLDSIEVPVLEGTLTMHGFAAEPPDGQGWRWSVAGATTPLSMERITQAFGWPTMHGVVSAEIPQIDYARSTLRVGGALRFRVFDGTVEARNLTLTEPFGRAPRLTADLDMRNLDLDLLTRTFAFGSITGRIDARVARLELVDWRPVRFDARLESSKGEYPRKISQAAVENIAALGGAGASAALQRTFLRFFEQFSYERLGLTCRLANGVCRMGGIEDTGQGYVIVKGSGIPALSVIGYNRSVDWPEFVERLKRVVQDKVHAVVR